MLNYSKLLNKLSSLSKDLFIGFANEKKIAISIWNKLINEKNIKEKLDSSLHFLPFPKFNEQLNLKFKNNYFEKSYTALAVDGSQIYYDKHQSLQLYLINIGFARISYSINKSIKNIDLNSEPFIFINSTDNNELINMQRSYYELLFSFKYSSNFIKENKLKNTDFLAIFDGSLLFSNTEAITCKKKETYLLKYLSCLKQFNTEEILCIGYISFPRSKELINIIKLFLTDFDSNNLKNIPNFNNLVDTDLLTEFLAFGERTIIFESCSSINTKYNINNKINFFYLNNGSEIIRVEFASWISKQPELISKICSIVLDQSIKGNGYPITLFEAHEQAIIRTKEKDFFYTILMHESNKYSIEYKKSQKNISKEKALKNY